MYPARCILPWIVPSDSPGADEFGVQVIVPRQTSTGTKDFAEKTVLSQRSRKMPGLPKLMRVGERVKPTKRLVLGVLSPTSTECALEALGQSRADGTDVIAKEGRIERLGPANLSPGQILSAGAGRHGSSRSNPGAGAGRVRGSGSSLLRPSSFSSELRGARPQGAGRPLSASGGGRQN